MDIWQILAAILLVMKVIGGFVFHGELREMSAGLSFINALVWFLILYGGGFFG